MTAFSARQINMVNSQILTNHVTDESVAEAILAVPREKFVPKELVGIAYIDEDIQVAPGRFLMEPMVLARMLQSAEVKNSDLALDISSLAGYTTAVLAALAGSVVGLEVDEELAERGNALLSKLDITNAAIVIGDLGEGMPAQGPYDVIMVNGAVEDVPEAWLDQLNDGGRLIAIEMRQSVGRAVKYQRRGDTVSKTELFDANCPMLPGFAKKAGFQF